MFSEFGCNYGFQKSVNAAAIKENEVCMYNYNRNKRHTLGTIPVGKPILDVLVWR